MKFYTHTPSSGEFLPSNPQSDSDLASFTALRHPGDLGDLALYQQHCPGVANPSVVFLDVVQERCGRLNDGTTLLHYRIRVTAYNVSTRSSDSFPVAVYLKNGKRWQNFPLLSGRIFGITKIRSELAVLADDLNFFPSSSRQQSTPTRPLESEELATAGRAEPAPPLRQRECVLRLRKPSVTFRSRR